MRRTLHKYHTSFHHHSKSIKEQPEFKRFYTPVHAVSFGNSKEILERPKRISISYTETPSHEAADSLKFASFHEGKNFKTLSKRELNDLLSTADSKRKIVNIFATKKRHL